MAAEIITHYAALLEAWPQLDNGMCVTYVEGPDSDAVIRAFGGEPAEAVLLTVDAAIDVALTEQPDADAVLFARLDGWTVVIEPLSGFRGESDAVLHAVAQTRAVAAFWSIAGVATFMEAAAGTTLYELDLNDPAPQALPSAVASLVEALGLGQDASYAPALGLAELRTGVRLTDEFLAGEFRTMLLPKR